MLEPLYFKPIYQDYLWGGERLKCCFGREDTPSPCAESWELSDREGAVSRVVGGSFDQATIRELIGLYGEDFLGHGQKEPAFPLLLKIIDAQKPLSIQVHPSEESAEFFGGDPKTEMWYVLQGGPVYAGLKTALSKKEFQQALREKRVVELLNKIDVHPGDALFIPGGRLHAIGAGCLLFEVQQNSNTTYRVYDWDRLDQEGKSRELHTKEALNCMKLDDVCNPLATPVLLEESASLRRASIIESLFFNVEKWELLESLEIPSNPHFYQIFFYLKKGQTILLPAHSKSLFLSKGGFLRVSPSHRSQEQVR